MLRTEGFTDIRYLDVETVAGGDIDFAFQTAAWVVSNLDAGEAVTALAGVHPGCYELFAHEPIRTISDLKGKRVGIDVLGSAKHVYLAIVAAHVGLDPQKDIEWVEGTGANAPARFPMELFVERRVDAFLGYRRSRRSCAPAGSDA